MYTQKELPTFRKSFLPPNIGSMQLKNTGLIRLFKFGRNLFQYVVNTYQSTKPRVYKCTERVYTKFEAPTIPINLQQS